MIIKKKSLIVAFVSSFVIFCVLVLTLVGYIVYQEIKSEEFRLSYIYELEKINARFYAKFIDISKLNAKMENSGPLKGNPIIEGVLKNKGNRVVTGLLIKVKLLDEDGAVIYEVTFHPNKPSLGDSNLTQAAMPYLYGRSEIPIRPNETMPFKKILNNCPGEIASELKAESGPTEGSGRWAGRLASEILSIEF
ncbi:MAG: hypothetical protein WC592_03440 [Candidatus Omnitrophota bacterium]|nr:hypothetical protein [Candidatus Omnitrophota bacterium]